MRVAIIRAAFAVCAAAALVTAGGRAARAQETPYQNQLVGERALGLAGAFVGVADDASAIFHNPGGLAALDTGGVAGSLWALVRGSREVAGGYETNLGSSDLQFSQPLSLPLFLAGVVKLGERDADGVRPHALGAALFTPLDRQYRFVNQLEAEGAVDRLEVRRGDSARWMGIAYGYQPRAGLSLGLSALLANRTFRHDEVEIRARAPMDSDAGVDAALSSASTLELEAHHLVFRIGTLLHITRELQAGLMFQLPAIELWASSEAEHLDTVSGAVPTRIAIVDSRDQPADVPMPWELRFGVTALHKANTFVTLDVSLFGPDGSATDPVRLVPEDSAEIGVFAPRTLYRRASLRGAIGFESVVGDVVPLRGGLFYERSPTAQLASRSSAYGADRIDSLGAAFSAGVRTSGYDLSIGASLIFGWGEGYALVRDDDPLGGASYRATDVDDRMLMVFVGGARSAVRTLVTTLVDE